MHATLRCLKCMALQCNGLPIAAQWTTADLPPAKQPAVLTRFAVTPAFAATRRRADGGGKYRGRSLAPGELLASGNFVGMARNFQYQRRSLRAFREGYAMKT